MKNIFFRKLICCFIDDLLISWIGMCVFLKYKRGLIISSTCTSSHFARYTIPYKFNSWKPEITESTRRKAPKLWSLISPGQNSIVLEPATKVIRKQHRSGKKNTTSRYDLYLSIQNFKILDNISLIYFCLPIHCLRQINIPTARQIIHDSRTNLCV